MPKKTSRKQSLKRSITKAKKALQKKVLRSKKSRKSTSVFADTPFRQGFIMAVVASLFFVGSGLFLGSSVQHQLPEVEIASAPEVEPITLLSAAPKITRGSFTLSTYGNYAFHQPIHQKAFFELLDENRQRVGSRQYFSQFTEGYRDEGEAITVADIDLNSIATLKVHYFSDRGPVTTFFSIPHQTKDLSFSLLISNYKLSPRLRIDHEEGGTAFVWPEGREAWPDEI